MGSDNETKTIKEKKQDLQNILDNSCNNNIFLRTEIILRLKELETQ